MISLDNYIPKITLYICALFSSLADKGSISEQPKILFSKFIILFPSISDVIGRYFLNNVLMKRENVRWCIVSDVQKGQ